MAKRKGKIQQALEAPAPVPKEPDVPAHWEHYSDGSGHLQTDAGHELFEYDEATREMRDGFDGEWRYFGYDETISDKMETAWEQYRTLIQPDEARAKQFAAHDIYYPAFPTVRDEADKQHCDRVFISDGVYLNMDTFEALSKDAGREYYDRYDKHLDDRELAMKISKGVQAPDDRNIACRFNVAGHEYSIQADSFEPMSPQEEQVLQRDGVQLYSNEETGFGLG